MTVTPQQHLDRIQFITGSIEGLIRLADEGGFEMLAYLLTIARQEADTVQARLKVAAR
ncbi:hypothetical protein [Hoeflea sp. BAL378]|uniref:hypothetical protein n=1 Tax=Hoeflea sp. BAL378 TaxID=1547437 RepID=UPI000A9F61A7|nr:hypothetical protein [Hoeflea sp. BAL378]